MIYTYIYTHIHTTVSFTGIRKGVCVGGWDEYEFLNAAKSKE